MATDLHTGDLLPRAPWRPPASGACATWALRCAVRAWRVPRQGHLDRHQRPPEPVELRLRQPADPPFLSVMPFVCMRRRPLLAERWPPSARARRAAPASGRRRGRHRRCEHADRHPSLVRPLGATAVRGCCSGQAAVLRHPRRRHLPEPGESCQAPARRRGRAEVVPRESRALRPFARGLLAVVPARQRPPAG